MERGQLVAADRVPVAIQTTTGQCFAERTRACVDQDARRHSAERTFRFVTDDNRRLCTQDPASEWTNVQPPPQVVDTSPVDSAGDERRYSVSYVFDDDERTDGQPRKPTLEPGTTYVARIRARNTHGWSEWSADVVTVLSTGTYNFTSVDTCVGPAIERTPPSVVLRCTRESCPGRLPSSRCYLHGRVRVTNRGDKICVRSRTRRNSRTRPLNYDTIFSPWTV